MHRYDVVASHRTSHPAQYVSAYANSAHRRTLPFVRLPPEIRIQIYRYCIPKTQVIVINPSNEEANIRWHERHWKLPIEDICPKRSSSFRVSKKISAETLEILYAGNYFPVDLLDHDTVPLPPQKLAEANRLGMRRLIIASRSELERPFAPDRHLRASNHTLPEGPWSSIL